MLKISFLGNMDVQHNYLCKRGTIVTTVICASLIYCNYSNTLQEYDDKGLYPTSENSELQYGYYSKGNTKTEKCYLNPNAELMLALTTVQIPSNFIMRKRARYSFCETFTQLTHLQRSLSLSRL